MSICIGTTTTRPPASAQPQRPECACRAGYVCDVCRAWAQRHHALAPPAGPQTGRDGHSRAEVQERLAVAWERLEALQDATGPTIRNKRQYWRHRIRMYEGWLEAMK